jgi:HAD superfamily hydrolase (TIGR01490 family)
LLKLAIFDLDNTLLAGDSDYAWGQFLVQKGIVDPDSYTRENERFYLQYKNKTLDIEEYQAFVLAPLMTLTVAERQTLHSEFMQSVIVHLRQTKADDLIKQHKDQGDRLLIITATNRFIAGPIGPWLGIDTVLATESEMIDGQFTGKIAGTPCFQEGKIRRLQEWLLAEGIEPEYITFYSDSINDLPLLDYAQYPVVVDPDDRLQAHAVTMGWPIISLKDGG